MTTIIKVAAAQLSPIFPGQKTVEKACSAILKAGNQGVNKAEVNVVIGM